MDGTISPLLFLEVLEGLKELRRSGWCQRGIPVPENVANHMFQMHWLCRLHPELVGEEETRAIFMCFVHDLGEVTAGDITPADGISPKEKHIKEKLGVQYLTCLLQESNPLLASTISTTWYEYEQHETKVARLVHQIDKLECLQQAYIYRKRYGEGHRLEEFKSLRDKIVDPWLATQADETLAEWAALEAPQTTPFVLVVGGPGVGKGTLCARIAEALGYIHISVGDLLRHEQNKTGSFFGQFILESVQNSIIVPPKLSILLLKPHIQKAQAQGKGLLLDGFPRSVDQAVLFEQEISREYLTLNLVCEPTVMIERVKQRSASSGRDDDDQAILEKRIRNFQATHQLVLEHIASDPGRTVKTVDASGSVDQVYATVSQWLQNITQ